MKNFNKKKVSLYEEYLRNSEFWCSKTPLETIIRNFVAKYSTLAKTIDPNDTEAYVGAMQKMVVAVGLVTYCSNTDTIFVITKDFGKALFKSKVALDSIKTDFFIHTMFHHESPNLTSGQYCLEFTLGCTRKNMLLSLISSKDKKLFFNIIIDKKMSIIPLDKPKIIDCIGPYMLGYEKYISFALKSILYIHGQNMDVKRMLAEKQTHNPKKNKQKRDNCESLFNYKLVGHSFHNKDYRTDEWGVATHMRFQPCGPGNTQVKLIWVKSHTRKRSENLIRKAGAA